MSVSKYSKHQRSSKPNWIATDSKTGKVLYSSNDRQEFRTLQRAYKTSLIELDKNS